MIRDNRKFRGKYTYEDFDDACLRYFLEDGGGEDVIRAYWKLDEIQDMIHSHFDRYFQSPEDYDGFPSDEIAFMSEVYSAVAEQDLMSDPNMVE